MLFSALISIAIAGVLFHVSLRPVPVASFELGKGRVFDIDVSANGQLIAANYGTSANQGIVTVFGCKTVCNWERQFEATENNCEWSSDGSILFTSQEASGTGKSRVVARSSSDWSILWSAAYPDPAPVGMRPISNECVLSFSGMSGDWRHAPYSVTVIHRGLPSYGVCNGDSDPFCIACCSTESGVNMATSYIGGHTVDIGSIHMSHSGPPSYVKTQSIDIDGPAWLEYSIDGQRLVALSDSQVCMYDIQSGKPVKAVSRGPRPNIRSVSFQPLSCTPDKTIFAYIDSHQVVVRDFESFDVLLILPVSADSLCLFPNSQFLAIGRSYPARIDLFPIHDLRHPSVDEGGVQPSH